MGHNFRELNVWKNAMTIVEDSYVLSSNLPAEERFSLVSKINRSAISIPSNIAEGSGRTTDKEFAHFLNISLSSAYELETQMILAGRLFKIEVKEIVEKLHELQKMIVGLKNSLDSKNLSNI